MARERLGDILIKAGLLTQEGLDRALEEQMRWGGPLGQYLIQLEIISEETLVRALSTQYRIPAVALDPPKLVEAIAKRIPQDICERNRLVCFRADDSTNFLDVAMADPSSLDAIDEVRIATHRNVRPFFAAPSAIDKCIEFIFYKGIDGAMGNTMDLSPNSALRLDKSELLQKTRTQGGSESLERVSTRQGDNGQIRRPPTDSFDISMEMDDFDIDDDSSVQLIRRLENAEKALTRNSALLQLLINRLIKAKILDAKSVNALLKK